MRIFKHEDILDDLSRTWYSDVLNAKAEKLLFYKDLDPFLAKVVGPGMKNWVVSAHDFSPTGVRHYQQQIVHIIDRMSLASNQSVDSMIEYVHF